MTDNNIMTTSNEDKDMYGALPGPITAAMLRDFHRSDSSSNNSDGLVRVKELLASTGINNGPITEINLHSFSSGGNGCLSTKIKTISNIPDCEYKIIGRVHRVRSQSKIIFLVIRQESNTLQCVYFKKDKTGDSLADLIMSITKESIVEVCGTTKIAKPIVKSCTVQELELEIKSIRIISKSHATLPLQIDEHIYLPTKTKGDDVERESKLVTRLNNRVLDLRKEDNQFIFKMQSAVSKIIRDYFDKYGFMEIHTPKLICAASEGGSNVFEVNYFNQYAYLAQSPQLYKQMAICGDFPRIYEIGPVFRAEKSFTHRHLTEFIGIDMEMTFERHYHEILDIFDNLFVNLFTKLQEIYGHEIDNFFKLFNVEPFEFANPSIRITFKEAIGLLRQAGIMMTDYEDFSTEKERILGKIIKEKYHTDFFMVDQFPTSVRPFYTMPNPENPLYSNSYDFFIRGEEILSGAQRISDYETLIASAKRHDIDTNKISDYLESFKYGVPLHGGGGIGLERVVMLYLGLNNIRNVSMFPRDPSRLAP